MLKNNRLNGEEAADAVAFLSSKLNGSKSQPKHRFIGQKLANRNEMERICDCCGDPDCCGFNSPAKTG